MLVRQTLRCAFSELPCRMCCVGIQQYSEDESPCPQVVVSAEEKKESDGVKRKGAARGTGSGTYIRWQGKAVMPES